LLLREKADWPYHSTCMLFLQFLDLWASARVAGRLIDVVVATATEQGRESRDEAGDDREDKGGVEAVAERAGDQVRKERGSRDRSVCVRRERGERSGPDQVLAGLRDRGAAPGGQEVFSRATRSSAASLRADGVS
jgi:hypothetical protein